MDSDDEAIPKESTKKSKTSSMDPVELNNLVVSMRKTTRQAKIHTIRTLTRQIELYRKKKGTEKQVQSFQKKAERLLEELKVIKKLDIDWISKFSLYNTSDLQGVVNKRVETKSMVRVATAKVLQTKVRGFRAAHKDWEELASYLISKTTGRRFKKRKLGKTIKLKPAAHLDTDQPRIGPALDSGLSVKDGKSKKKGEANEVVKDKEKEDMKERSKVIQDLEGDESEEEEEEEESVEEGDEESEEEEAEEREEEESRESEEEQGEECEVQKKESRVKSVNSDSEENVENESGDSGQESENSNQGSDGQESESDGQDSESDDQESDSDGQDSESDGQDSESDGQDSDNDGQKSDSDGQDSDGSENRNESDNDLESEKLKETIRIPRIKPEKPKKVQKKLSQKKISIPSKSEQKKTPAQNPKQKQKVQTKNLSKGLMVIKKFNLEDSPEEEEDKADVSFLFEKEEAAKVADKGIKDSFFQGSDSEESQNDSGGDISDVSDEEGSSEYPQQTLVDSSFTKSLSNQKRKGKVDHSVGRDSKFGGRGGRFDRGRGGRGRDSFRGGGRFERGGSSFSGRGRGDGFSRGRGDGGFSRGRDGFSRGRDGFSRGRGEGGFSRGRGDGFIRGRGDGRGRGRGDRREYSQDSRDFQGSGKRFHRDENSDRSSGYWQDNKRTKWEKADRPAGNQWPAKDPKKDSATKELHPSWQASLKKKQELQIMNFQGKKTVFNDD